MKRPSVLVIRPNGRFSSVLREEGFEVTNLELIQTEPLNDLTEAEAIISTLDEYAGLFFTSGASARIFGRLLKAGKPHYAGKLYVLGTRAKAELESAGLAVVHRETAANAAEMISSFDDSEFRGRRFLYVRGERSLRVIPEILGKIADIDELAVYRTLAVEPNKRDAISVKQRLERGEFGWVCFFSPSGVERFLELFGDRMPGGIKSAAVGETTAERIGRAGLNIGFVARRPNAEAFAADLAAYIKDIG